MGRFHSLPLFYNILCKYAQSCYYHHAMTTFPIIREYTDVLIIALYSHGIVSILIQRLRFISLHQDHYYTRVLPPETGNYNQESYYSYSIITGSRLIK